MINEITENLIYKAKNGDFDVIAHGCNCHHSMNSGIAKQIKYEIPEAFAVDLETPYGDVNKLGTISYTINHPFTVVNCYTQYHSGKDGVYADYDAIEKSLLALKLTFPGKRIGIPKIGAGRARGDWNRIKAIIENVFNDFADDITIVHWDQPDPNQQSTNTKRSKRLRTPSSQQLISKNMTNPHKLKGKRNCIYCHNRKPVRELINYVPKVWCCKDQCHDKFFNIVAAYNPTPAVVKLSNNALVTSIDND